MKVSAPQFMSSSAPPVPPADAPAPTPETPADPGAPPPPPEPPKQAAWPDWFVGADNALIVMALLFAFLMGSFAARNADVFRHMAAGKRLVSGTYSLGADPFSYTGTDRPWVNQSWLFDLTAYAAYSVDNTGAVAVVLKAVVFAAAFGVLLWFRRPGQAGWPWAVMIVAAALAASGQANLRPVVFGTLFGSLLLLAVFRGDWSAGGRNRTLLTVGVLCWLWGGFDPFAILAPAVVLVVALGGAIQRAVIGAAPAPDGTPEQEPELFAAPPPPNVLLRVALVGLLGVLLNPTFVIGLTRDAGSAVAQLVPVELTFGLTPLAEDPEFRSLTHTLLTPNFWKYQMLGIAGSAGLAVLVVVGAVALAVGVGRVPGGWMGLWFFALLLCLFASARFVPLFAAVAVPLVAGLLNALSDRFRLGTTADRRTQGLLTASRLGRVVTVPAFLVLLAGTVPGWLHPQANDRALARRVEWRIATDEAAVRGLAQLQQWRAEDDLPGDARGYYTSPDLGDYAAWFAPAERVSANTRFRFHAAELDDLIQVRSALVFPNRGENTPPPPPVAPVLDRANAEYLVLGRPNPQPGVAPAVQSAVLALTAGRPDGERLRLDPLWYLDGRTAVVGRTVGGRAAGPSRHPKLALDPARLAFAPHAGLPDGPLEMPLKQDAGWLERLLLAPPLPAAYRDDGQALNDLAELTVQAEAQKEAAVQVGVQAAVGGWGQAGGGLTDAELALPLLVHRAARQAIHQTPDDPFSYFLLAQAHRSPYVPQFEPREAARQRLVGFARATARLGSAENLSAGQLHGAGQLAGELFAAQLEMDQFDLARDTVKELRKLHAAAEEANGGLPVPIRTPLWQAAGLSLERLIPTYKRVTGQDLQLGRGDFEFEDQAKKSGRNEPPSTAALMKKLDDSMAAVVGRVNEEWDTRTRQLKPGQRALAAIQFGLPKAALGLLKEAKDLGADSAGVPPAEMALQFVSLELAVGQLEQAARDLADLDAQAADLPDFLRARVTELKLQKLRLQGNYKEARTVLDESRAGRFPRLTDREKELAANPFGQMTLIGIAAPPFGAPDLLPAFQPPPTATRRDEVAKLAAAFQKAYLSTHPVLAPGAPLRDRLLGEAQYFYQRGVLALLDGDTPAAEESFRQALAPQGVRVDYLIVLTQQVALRGGMQFTNPELVDLTQAAFPSMPLLPGCLRLIGKYRNAAPAR